MKRLYKLLKYPEFPIATIPQSSIESTFQWPESVVNSKQILIVHGADHTCNKHLQALQLPVLSDIISNKLAQLQCLRLGKSANVIG